MHGRDAPPWWLAYLVRATIGAVLLRLFRVRFLNAGNVPAGGAILAGNHVSYLDPILLWSGGPRPVHFVAKSELWQSRFFGWCLDQFWAFPIDRAGADRQAISTATALLEHGELIGMFPEGTRKRGDTADLGEAHGGVAFIAMRANVPVVPVGIVGTQAAWPAGQKRPRFVPVTMSFGSPIDPDDFAGSRKERVAAMTSSIMGSIDEQRSVAKEG
jgi:1-acyl-sn-glycerol-3-phosphate acyltransferase